VGPPNRMAPRGTGRKTVCAKRRCTHPKVQELKGVSVPAIGPVPDGPAVLITVVGITAGLRLGLGAQALVSQ
jgi:hypothetical protein